LITGGVEDQKLRLGEPEFPIAGEKLNPGEALVGQNGVGGVLEAAPVPKNQVSIVEENKLGIISFGSVLKG